jgi:O-antigen/teichoic acid export membrane protein
MSAFMTRLRNSRVVHGIGANVYGQIVQTALQLLAVPIYATHWGLATYGAWLVIFTVPNYLAFADFGFALAAANDMTVSVARGDRAAAVKTFHAVRAAMIGICSLLLLVCVVAVYSIPDGSLGFVPDLSHDQARYVLLMLGAYGVLSIQNSISLAAFRSIGKYAEGTYLSTSIHLAENLGALVVVTLGGNMEAAAATYLIVGLAGMVVRMVWLRIQAGWLVYFSWHVHFGEVRRLLNPAFAVLALPMAQALFIQGTVGVVGLAGGAASVPAFTTVRTLSRIGLQLTMIVNNAVVPEFTMAAASVDHGRRARLAFMCIASSALILIPMFLIVVTAGPLMLKLWTHGAIHAPYALIVLMAATMIVNGTWLPIANLIFALNHTSRYSYFYLAASAVSVLLSYPLVRWLGSPGAAVSLLALDCVMFAHVWRLAMALDVFDPKEVYDTARAEGARLGSLVFSRTRRTSG